MTMDDAWHYWLKAAKARRSVLVRDSAGQELVGTVVHVTLPAEIRRGTGSKHKPGTIRVRFDGQRPYWRSIPIDDVLGVYDDSPATTEAVA